MNEIQVDTQSPSVATETSLPSGQVETATRYVITLYHATATQRNWDSINPALIYHLRGRLKQIIDTEKANTEIDIWLDSGGGDLHSAYKLILIAQSYCSKLRVIIPDYAKSAATLIAIAADELYMGLAAELGPLDAQIPHPEREEIQLSALDYANALDHLANTALGVVLASGNVIMNMTKLTRQQIFSPLLDFAAAFFSPAVDQLDPSLVHSAVRVLKIAEDYCLRLLLPKVLGTTDLEKRKRLLDLPKRLIEYSSHGFVIDAKEISELGLDPLPSGRYNDWRYAYKLWETIRSQNTFYIDATERNELIKTLEAPQGEA